MEWVVTTARTVDEAKEAALDQLGVDAQDAEFEVLEEPRQGLFGRLRGEAKVRARVRPTTPRPKADRRDRRRKGGDKASASAGGGPAAGTAVAADEVADAGPGDDAADAPAASDGGRSRAGRRAGGGNGGNGRRPKGVPTAVPAVSDEVQEAAPAAGPAGSEREEQPVQELTLEDEGATAAAFLTGLAQAFGAAETSTSVAIEEADVEVHLDGQELGLLIGPRGQTLQAIQDLTRTVANRAGASRATSLRIDIGGYRERRKAALRRFTQQVAEQVRASGVPKALEPMIAADRKVVHDTVLEIDGVTTTSEGEEPNRYVVLRPAETGEAAAPAEAAEPAEG